MVSRLYCVIFGWMSWVIVVDGLFVIGGSLRVKFWFFVLLLICGCIVRFFSVFIGNWLLGFNVCLFMVICSLLLIEVSFNYMVLILVFFFGVFGYMEIFFILIVVLIICCDLVVNYLRILVVFFCCLFFLVIGCLVLIVLVMVIEVMVDVLLFYLLEIWYLSNLMLLVVFLLVM